MVHLSLLPLFTRGTLPHCIEQFFCSRGDGVYPVIDIPTEMLDYIIDFLHDDKKTLMTLSLVSRHTLVKSRFLLFSHLVFVDEDRKLDTFLTLLDVKWTTFTHTVESLHIKDQFNRFSTKKRGPFVTKNIRRIAANLSHIKTLRLTSVSWPYIPQYTGDIFFQLNLTGFHLESVEFRMDDITDFVNFFVKLQPSVRSISIYDLQFDDAELPDLSVYPTIFRRPIHMEKLDTSSLILFKDVWDPLHTNDLDITVDSFYMRFANISSRDRATYVPFFSRFLKHVGPSLSHLFIKLTEGYWGYGM